MSTHPIRKAVVPAAGLGTRHFPASQAVKKELFPVVGPDGIARALLHYHLLELTRVGIEEICVIVQPGGDQPIRDYLNGPDAEYLHRLEKYPALAAEARSMRDLSTRVRFAVQHQQDGYGHAVFQTRAFAGGEAVLLCLGDHLFRGGYEQLLAAGKKSAGRSVSAVNRIGPAELKGFGTIAGRRRAGDVSLIDVSLIIEKPSVKIARERLHVDGMPADTFLGWFGMHLLAPSIYEVLARMIADDVRDHGEIQLTRAQELQRLQEGYLAVDVSDAATRFDFGTPADYVAALVSFQDNAGRISEPARQPGS